MLSGAEGFLGSLEFLLSCALTLYHLSVETALLFLVDDIIGIIIDVLILLDLFWVVDNHIGLEVKFGCV